MTIFIIKTKSNGNYSAEILEINARLRYIAISTPDGRKALLYDEIESIALSPHDDELLRLMK